MKDSHRELPGLVRDVIEVLVANTFVLRRGVLPEFKHNRISHYTRATANTLLTTESRNKFKLNTEEIFLAVHPVHLGDAQSYKARLHLECKTEALGTWSFVCTTLG